MRKFGLGNRIALLAATAALAACGDGYEVENEEASGTAAAATVETPAQRLADAWNGSWITLSGRVVGKGADRFQLDYGTGRVTVEMDDWDWFSEGNNLLAGDNVTVTGRIDRDFLEQKKIEASSVYVNSLGTVFYANPQDEEDIVGTTVYVPGTPGAVVATGTVRGIEGREFTVGGSDGGEIRVDTAKMSDNPLDAEGKLQVKAGQRVQVWGRLNVDPNERSEIMADGLAVLTADRSKAAGQSKEGGQAKAEGQKKS